MRQQAQEAATFDGILRVLSERRGRVRAWTADGGEVVGEVRALSAELVQFAAGADAPSWIVRSALAGVETLSHGNDAGVASDDRGPTSSATLAGLLAELAEERSAVTARCGGAEISGRVVGAGADVLTLRRASGQVAYLPIPVLSLLRLG